MSATALDPRLQRPPARPPLRVIPGGRSPVASTLLRRRRLVAGGVGLVVAALLVGGVATGFGVLLGAVGGAPDPTGPAPAAPAGADTVVVRPGDTLWSVARRVEPEGDVRATVDRLAEANGGPRLQVGQVLVLP